MPIVLAIEPDRRQAAHLTAIVRHQVGAELVLAHTTEGALDAIGNRVPDLVLVPALLSPQDDAALAAALRVIAAAAHVRTLTIPVLASGIAHAPREGLLSKWRKSRPASPEPDGCDPAVFGEQITAYLQEAAAERAEMEDVLGEDEPAEVASRIAASPAAMAIAAGPELPHETPTRHGGIDVEAAALFEEPLIDLSDELASLSSDAHDELFDGEQVGVYTIPEETGKPAFEPFDLLPAIQEPRAIAEPFFDTVAQSPEVAAPAHVAEPPEVAEVADATTFAELAEFADLAAPADVPEPALAALTELVEAFGESGFVAPRLAEPIVVEPGSAEPMFAEPLESPRADIEPWVPMYLTPGRMWPALEGVPAETPVARVEQPDWIELVASLRQDLERRRTDPASAAADSIAARPSDGVNAETDRLVRKQRTHAQKAKPVQDEWGFFDPEQCGFSTLLAKLEEITDDGTVV